MIGQEVFGYRVEELIGKGSFASVYKVKKENESGTYIKALKHIIIPERYQYQRIWNAMGRNSEKTDRYFEQVFQETMQEIRLMHAFTERGIHNIVSCYENDVIFHESPKQYEIFLLMEYLTPLSQYIGQKDLSIDEVLNLGIQILNALEVCHKNHIIHRDIKEDNIFLDANGDFKLGDFGVAKVFRDNGLIASVKGTSGYMAPEILKHSGEYDETVDLYSLGMVLYRLLNHMRSPFFPPYPNEFSNGDEERALRRRMNEEKIPLPDAVPPSLGKVITKALAKKNQRFQSAEEFRDELIRIKKILDRDVLQRSAMTGNIICAESDSGYPRKKANTKKKISKRVIITFIIIILLSSVGIGSGYVYHQSQRRALVEKWVQSSVFPFAIVSMEMTENDFKNYYRSNWRQGMDGQDYLELEGDNTNGYVTLSFQDNILISANYQFSIKEKDWITLCQEYYQDTDIGQDKWPYVLNRESAKIILDYNESGNLASVFIKRTEE